MPAKTPFRVLIADDDAGVRDLVRSTLRSEGYLVDCVPSGARALEMLTPERYDGLVLDITMPGMDGFSVLGVLRERTQPVPVLVMSARHSPDDVRKAVSLGAKDYLAKPFSTAQLVSRMARLVRHAEQAARTSVSAFAID